MVAVSNESVIQARRLLRAMLAAFYGEKQQAMRVVDDAGLLKSNITFSDRSVDNWHYILQEAENQQKLDDLIKVVKLEYNTNLEFHEVCRRYEDVLSQQGAKSSKEVEVSFTNRIDEINDILSTNVAAYHRLNALMGYGKTKLLLELERRFREEQNWLCAYVCVDLNSGLKELTTALVQELGISSWYNSADRSASPSDGALLGNALNRFWQRSGEPGKGIALLIDFDVRPSNREQTKLIESFVRKVWEELIPEVQKPLRSLKNFKENHNRFRVIMASRPVTITYLSYPVSSRNLSPFTFDVIRSSVATFLSEVDIEDINQFAAHLFYLTGGHPGCMAKTLKLYSETMLPPDEWLEKYEDIVWRDIIRTLLQKVTTVKSRAECALLVQ